MKLLAIVAVVLALLAGLYAWRLSARPRVPDDPIYGRDAAATKIAVLAIIPIGTPADAAMSTMKAKGFRCGMAPAADILQCDTFNLWAGWRSVVLDMRWQVTFTIKDGAVASVDAKVMFAGP